MACGSRLYLTRSPFCLTSQCSIKTHMTHNPPKHVATPYKPSRQIRFITATSLFDGHDASINIMRRLLQATGVEVIHLGHNRSVNEIVTAALQ